jgi:hypothetical protein
VAVRFFLLKYTYTFVSRLPVSTIAIPFGTRNKTVCRGPPNAYTFVSRLPVSTIAVPFGTRNKTVCRGPPNAYTFVSRLPVSTIAIPFGTRNKTVCRGPPNAYTFVSRLPVSTIAIPFGTRNKTVCRLTLRLRLSYAGASKKHGKGQADGDGQVAHTGSMTENIRNKAIKCHIAQKTNPPQMKKSLINTSILIYDRHLYTLARPIPNSLAMDEAPIPCDLNSITLFRSIEGFLPL